MSLVSAPRTMPTGPQVVTLYTGNAQVNDEIKKYCANDKQKTLWLKPAVDVEAFANRVDPVKVMTRPGYLNAVLIQSRGRVGIICQACSRDPVRGPFAECRRVQGHFGGCCGNCKWRDHAVRCSVYNEQEEEEPVVLAVEGSAEAPIELDSE